jgi:hypothetical protein
MKKKKSAEEKEEEKEVDSYLKEHLRSYIEFQLKQGYEYEDIKKTLKKQGYTFTLVDEISKGLDKEHHVSDKTYTQEELDKESYYYLRGVLADYIKTQLEHSYKLEHVKKALINSGHDEHLVNEASKFIKQEVSKQFPGKAALVISIVIIFAFIFSLGVSLNHASSMMILAFFPAILALIINYILMSNRYTHKFRNSLPGFSVVLVIVLYLALVPRLSADLDYGVILVLNVIIAVLLTTFMLLFSKK